MNSLIFGIIFIIIGGIIAIISYLKNKKLKKYYSTLFNELIGSSDFNGLKRIETIANMYKEFNKENSKDTSKLRLSICNDILDKIQFTRLMRTTTTKIEENENKITQIKEAENNEALSNKKTKKGV